MDFSQITTIEIPEGKVVRIQDKDNKVLWDSLSHQSYGIQLTCGTYGYTCHRIGNTQLHKTLPIQSKFAVCIHQGTDIKYWAHPDDSRFRKDTTEYTLNNVLIMGTTDTSVDSTWYSPDSTYNCTIMQPGTPDPESSIYELQLLCNTYKYKYCYVKIGSVIARVEHCGSGMAYLKAESPIETGSYTIEFGCSINGYDGEIGVYTPSFYIWSVCSSDYKDCQILISEKKCVDYANNVKAHITAVGYATLLSTAAGDDKWGYLNTLEANTAVSVINYQPMLRGGNKNVTTYDTYLGQDNFRSLYCKGVTAKDLQSMRIYAQKTTNKQLLYYQFWSAILWCYCIEYGDIDVRTDYNPNLTVEGYHQGGLGGTIYGFTSRDTYNSTQPLVPNDFTLSLGNKTGVITKPSWSYTSGEATIQIPSINIPHYRGFNLFWHEDCYINLENLLQVYDATAHTPIFYYANSISDFSNNTTGKDSVAISNMINDNTNHLLYLIQVQSDGKLLPNSVTTDSTISAGCGSYIGGTSPGIVTKCLVGKSMSNGRDNVGLMSMVCTYGVQHTENDGAYITTTILEN